MENLKIVLIQTDIFWENVAANLAILEEKIWNISNDFDLIILPEMFNTGFSMNPKTFSEPSNGHTTKWMKMIAAQTKSAICGSIAIKENGFYYNRFLFVTPNGNIQTYDKIHTFCFAGEDKVYNSGSKKVIIDYKNWKINPQICYDLRFPENARNQIIDDKYAFDLIIYCANWPESRVLAWNHLLEARAIENSCFVIGINRIGEDGRKQKYNGNSAFSFALPEHNKNFGEIEKVIQFELSTSLLSDYRKKFPFLKDIK